MSQRTPGPGRLPALTGLRFFAALLIVAYHFAQGTTIPFLSVALGSGYLAVNFFFLLSGFILTYNYLDVGGAMRTPRRAYFLARAARILPLYYLAMAVSFLPDLRWRACAALLPECAVSRLNPLPALTLTQAWIPGSTVLDPPGWSISAEVVFYAALPLVALPIARSMRRSPAGTLGLLWALMLLPALLCWLLGGGDWWTRVVTLGPLFRLPEFAAGMGLGFLYLRYGALPGRWLPPLTCLLLAITFYAASRWLPYVVVHNGLLDPLFGALIYGMAGSRGWLARPRLVLLGEASYALYLLHWPVHEWLAPRAVPFPVYLVAAVAASLAVYRYVEQPARRAIRGMCGGSVQLRRGAGMTRGVVLVVLIACSVGILWHMNVTAAAPAPIGFIGDSITANARDGITPANVAATALHTTSVNMAVAGTRTDQWLPGTALFSNAASAFKTSGVREIALMLGTNDARLPYRVSPAAYATHLAAICRALTRVGFTVVVSFSPHAVVGAYRGTSSEIDDATDSLIHAYEGRIRDLAARGICRLGATNLYIATQRDPALLWDGIHPTYAGVRLIGAAWATRL